MRPVVWMVAACGASWWVLAALFASAGPELPMGMAGPLVATGTSWLVVSRTFRASPTRVAGLMLTGFFLKMIFFGVYVVVALKVLHLRAVPFAVSFTCYFIALHLSEALLFRRLFGAAAPASRS